MLEQRGDVRVLRPIHEGTCDGVHPESGLRCVLGDHKGYHQAADSTKWLDEE